MTLVELQALIGELTGDPNHDRYTISDINTELDNSQTKWNLAAKIIRHTLTLTVVDGQSSYALSDFTGTPLAICRVTHKGLELDKRSKSYFDLYHGTDWTLDNGTPTEYCINAGDTAATETLLLHPVPGGGDAGAYLVVEYIVAHTPMTSDSDVPFLSGTGTPTNNFLLRPYDWGLAYDAASRLLMRDPNAETTFKIDRYNGQANGVLADLLQTFKALEKEEPYRVRGGRRW